MKKFGGMSGDELQRPHQFEHENAWLKRALAERMLDTRISKEQNAKNGGAAPEAPSRGPDQRGLAETNLGSMHAEANQKGDETVRASPLCASSFEAEHPGLPRANTEKERVLSASMRRRFRSGFLFLQQAPD